MRLPSLVVLRTQSDDRLVALARTGNEQAFEAIVERYRRPLLRHAERLLAETGAEDAVQQAFLSAWTALQRGDDVRELNAWLHRIVHNVALNALRGARRGEHAELHENVAAGVGPEEEIERRMAMRRTLADVAALPERQREALLRVAVQGRSQAEVARTLGLSHGAVGQLVMRGRRALRGAATALTPQWLVNWLATLGTEGQHATATLGKVAAVVAVAGAATTGPALVEHRDDHPRPIAEARAADDRSAPRRAELPGGARVEPEEGLDRSGSGSGTSGSGSSGTGSGGSGPRDDGTSGSDTSGTGTSGSGTSGSGTSGSDTSGSGTSGSGTSGSGTSGSGTSGSGTSGSGTSGSGTSGSGTSGSGTSGSGTSGSGTSGSGTSGSGTSGSGTSGSGTSDSGTSGSGTSGSGTSDSGTSGSGTSGSGTSGTLTSGSGTSGSGVSGSGTGDTSGTSGGSD